MKLGTESVTPLRRLEADEPGYDAENETYVVRFTNGIDAYARRDDLEFEGDDEKLLDTLGSEPEPPVSEPESPVSPPRPRREAGSASPPSDEVARTGGAASSASRSEPAKSDDKAKP